MAKTALIAAITDYPNDDLEAAVPEAERWAELLKNFFGFPAPALLRNSEVMVDTVIGELERRLDAATVGDQIVFVWAGHGDSMSTSGSFGEEALIFADGPLTETRFSTLVKDHYRAGAFTVVLETCYAGGFASTPLVRGLRRLAAIVGFQSTKFASPAHARGFRESFVVTQRFGDMESVPREQKRPLIVAACDANELAAQAPIVPRRPLHMVFSEQAIPFLEQNPSVTHETFLDKVGRKVVGQHVTLKGDLGRLPNTFFT